jgi:hypothetical protein
MKVTDGCCQYLTSDVFHRLRDDAKIEVYDLMQNFNLMAADFLVADGEGDAAADFEILPSHRRP